MKAVTSAVLLCALPLLSTGQQVGCFDTGECLDGASGMVSQTVDANACLEDCKNDAACLYFTYDKATDICLHLSYCPSLTNTHYTNLFTGHASCEPAQCGTHGHCDGSSVSVMIADTLEECFTSCLDNAFCNWWTYSYSGDKFCSLFEDCPRIDTSCDYCLYGQKACENVTTCADPWKSYPGSSQCVQVFNDNVTYLDALVACQNEGSNGDLASVHRQAQQDFLENLYASDGINEDVWIGINDMLVEDQFAWTDGSEVDFTSWLDSEPNDGEGDGEDCGYMRAAYDWGWNDYDCTAGFFYLCQIDRQ